MIIAVVTIMLALSGVYINSTDFDHQIGTLVQKLGEIESKGIDVSNLTYNLDQAVRLYQRGDVGKAQEILLHVEKDIAKLEEIADNVALWKNVEKWLTIAALASIPVALYILLPRLYLYLWYVARREWIVEVKKR